MKRRDFLKTILLAGVAPAVISSANAMKIYVPSNKVAVVSYLDSMAHLYGIERKLLETDKELRQRVIDSSNRMYKASEVKVTLGGQELTGYADDTFITLSRGKV